MTEIIECPICMDCIGEKNCVTTECGHKFHANCMFKNIDKNGFKCPCCRNQMIEQEEEYEEYEEYEEEQQEQQEEQQEQQQEDEEEEEEEIVYEEETGPFTNDALRGLRLLTNLLEGEEQDPNDVIFEYNYIRVLRDATSLVADPFPPSLHVMEQGLIAQGVTYKQLLAWILTMHDEYDGQGEELETFYDNLWEKIRILISGYQEQQEQEEEEQEEEEQEDEPIVDEPIVDEPIVDEPIVDVPIVDEPDVPISMEANTIDDIRMDLAHFMVDYAAQPKTQIHIVKYELVSMQDRIIAFKNLQAMW